MKTAHAIYENGAFRPTDRVELPEHCEVEFEPRVVGLQHRPASLEDVYAILSRRYRSGAHDIAERHNEHQP